MRIVLVLASITILALVFNVYIQVALLVLRFLLRAATLSSPPARKGTLIRD